MSWFGSWGVELELESFAPSLARRTWSRVWMEDAERKYSHDHEFVGSQIHFQSSKDQFGDSLLWENEDVAHCYRLLWVLVRLAPRQSTYGVELRMPLVFS